MIKQKHINKYHKWYLQLIEKARGGSSKRGIYTEMHHILPRHAGGTNHQNNLVILSFREHTLAHLLLWKAFGRKQDETAYKLMKGVGSGERKQLIASVGGTIQGRNNAVNGHMRRIQRMVNWCANGKRSAEICRQRKVNAFFDPKLKKEICSKGGRIQGQANALNGHLKRIALLPRKRKLADCIWITNGIENRWLETVKEIPNGWKRGRTLQRRKKTTI